MASLFPPTLVLDMDSRGPEVALLQAYLNGLYRRKPIAVSGVFTKETSTALIQLQIDLSMQGTEVTGAFDLQTRQRLIDTGELNFFAINADALDRISEGDVSGDS